MPIGRPALSPTSRRTTRRRSLATAALLGIVGLSACRGLADLVTPGTRNADLPPARLALEASVALASTEGANVASLDVLTSYLRRDGAEVRLGTQSMRLTSAERQAVPIAIDIAACLADPERDGASGSCAVMLNLALLVNGVVVDRQVIGPVRLTPGAPASAPAPVTLFEVAALQLLDAGGTPLAAETVVTLAPGAARALGVRVLDSRGANVTDRTVTWRSDAPEVATVSSSGVVTAVAAGTTRITASLGALSSSLTTTVVRPPVALVVRGRADGGRGIIRSTPAGIDCRLDGAIASGACTAEFAADAAVTLHAIPEARARFTGWGDACASVGGEDRCTLVLSAARDASAGFIAVRTVTLVPSAGSDGRGRISGSGLDCRLDGAVVTGTCTVDVLDGAELSLEAAVSEQAAAQRFAGWGAPCASASAAHCTLTVRGGDVQVPAGFLDARPLSVTLRGAGGGTVSGLPEAACALVVGTAEVDCAARVEHGRVVTLAATPEATSQFAGWSGACTGTAPTCTVSVTEARSVVATFTRRRATLSVRVSGPGEGLVRLDGAPFCRVPDGGGEATCVRDVDAGTRVELQGASTGAFSAFAGFGEACAGTAACALTIDRDATVHASFSVLPVRLEVLGSGPTTGSGRVTAAGVDGLDCALTLGTAASSGCTATTAPLAPVSLIARAAPSSILVSWGDACAHATTVTCHLVPSAATTPVSARFMAANDVDLILDATAGGGTVWFDIPGVPTQASCSAARGEVKTCRYALPAGATGVFRAEFGPQQAFLGFNGFCNEGTTLVSTCTYRGYGFLREVRAVFTSP